MKRISEIFIVAVILIISVSGCSNQEQELSDKVNAFARVSEYKKALELVDEFILSNPSNPFGRELKTKVLLWEGDVPAALEEYKRYYEFAQKHSRDLIEQFVLKYKSSKLEDFVETFLGLEISEESDLNEILSDVILASFQKRELSPEQARDYISALSITRSDNAAAFLANFAKDEKEVENVRIAAIDAIPRNRGQEGIKDLLPLLKDSLESIRLRAAGTLIWLGNYDGSDIFLQYALGFVKNERANQLSTKKTGTMLVYSEWETLNILCFLSEYEAKAKQELLDILSRMATTGDWDDGSLIIILSAIKNGCPPEAIESLLMVIEKFPGSSSSTYSGVFVRSISCLENANKTPDQVRRVEEALVKFVKRGCGMRSEPIGEKNSTRIAFEYLEKLAPQRAKQLKKEISKSKLRSRGIN